MNLLFSGLMILLGCSVIYTGTAPLAPFTEAQLHIFKYPVGIFFILIGIASYIDDKKKKI